MKILCIDTSSQYCSVAILEDKKLINKIELNNGLTHSESLMPSIKTVLNESKLNLNDINLIVCDIGPGSFTGLRIGIATAKAFADSLNIPTVGISALEILAYNIKDDGLICSTIDCKNNNCYFALYSLENGIYNVVEPPSAKSNDEVMELLNSKYSDKNINFVGDTIFSILKLHKGIINLNVFQLTTTLDTKTNSLINNQNNNKTSSINKIQNNDQNHSTEKNQNNSKIPELYLNIENLGIAGFTKFVKNNFVGEEILPLYLKKPQAQIQLEAKK